MISTAFLHIDNFFQQCATIKNICQIIFHFVQVKISRFINITLSQLKQILALYQVDFVFMQLVRLLRFHVGLQIKTSYSWSGLGIVGQLSHTSPSLSGPSTSLSSWLGLGTKGQLSCSNEKNSLSLKLKFVIEQKILKNTKEQCYIQCINKIKLNYNEFYEMRIL